MSYATRITTWADDDSVASSDLNAEFNIALNALSDGSKDINVAAATTSTLAVTNSTTIGTTLAVTGASTFTGNIQGAGEVRAGIPAPSLVQNLGITYAAGVFTITGYTGTALSATNYAYITMPSTTAGQSIRLKCTTPNFTFQDAAGTSDLTNLEFGIDTTVNWATMPFFIYAVNRGNADFDGTDGNSVFAISRSPSLTTTPALAANIHDTGGLGASDTQDDIMILSDVTVANYTSKPCMRIGAFNMSYATSTHDWTVQTFDYKSGIGPTYLSKAFAFDWTFPTGQSSADSASYIQANGGVGPAFSSTDYSYRVRPDGMVDCRVHANGDGGTDGSGAVTSNLSLPTLVKFVSTRTHFQPLGVALGQTTITGGCLAIGAFTHGNNYAALSYQSGAATNSAIQNNMFTNGNRLLQFTFSYRGF